MIVIYHNPRCRKSRECLALIETKTSDFQIYKYLDEPLTEKQLKEVISLLNIEPIELVRKNESLWKENFKHQKLAGKELIKVMVNNPKLIERPIVINGDKAVIGRPPESVLTIIK